MIDIKKTLRLTKKKKKPGRKKCAGPNASESHLLHWLCHIIAHSMSRSSTIQELSSIHSTIAAPPTGYSLTKYHSLNENDSSSSEERKIADVPLLDVSAQLAVGADYALCIFLPTLSIFKRKPNNTVMATIMIPQ